MKKILFILISFAFLQAPANICPGNTPATYLCACTTEWNKDSTKLPEELTEEDMERKHQREKGYQRWICTNRSDIHPKGKGKIFGRILSEITCS